MNRIKRLDVKLFRVPLEEQMVDALHGLHTHFELITATVTLDNGTIGTGYTYTGGLGGASIAKLISNEIEKIVEGVEFTEPSEVSDLVAKSLHYVGRGGILSFAVSALDTALWDAVCKLGGKTLRQKLGINREKVRTYYGGIDLAYDMDRLLKNIEKQFEAGHNAIKIKLGRENMQEDIDRVKAVRNLIGDKCEFMVDANMIFSPEDAVKLSKSIEEYDIKWFEEPCNPDDLEGYAYVAGNTNIPVAMGENLHIFAEHKNAIDIGKIQYPQPDISNIGGISGWLKVAQLAKENNMIVSSHGMQELHANIMAAVENPGYVEYHSFPIYKYIVDELKVKDGYIYPINRDGIGIEFDWKRLAEYEK